MTLRLNGSSSGFTEINAPAAAGSNTITLPTSNGSANQFLKNSGTAGELEFSSMVETSTGVGIGTTSPSSKLNLSGGAENVLLETTNSSGDAFFGIRNDSYGLLGAGDAYIYRNGGNIAFLADGASDAIKFASGGNSERVRITSAGLLVAGTLGTVPNGEHHFKANSDDDNVGAIRFDNTDTAAAACVASIVTATNSTATSNALVKFGINSYSSGSGQINANGSNQCAFGTFSDERLKENITSLPSQWDNIKNLRPVEFDYIESQGGEHQVGFIAQEFQTVYPDSVGSQPMFTGANEQSDEERLTITGWSKTEARLVKALQEAIAKIETLEAKVAALEAA